MQLRQKAREIFEKFFGKVEEKLLFTSDKEFFTNHINFTFGESFVKANLDTQKYFLITLASTLAVGGKIEFKALLQGAIKNDISPIVIKEVIYQATPYVGFARVCDFLSLCNKVFKKLNIALVLTPQGTTTQENRKIKGREIQNAIFGEANITKTIESTLEDKAFINDFLSANCFGDYYTRTGLDLKTRELLTLMYLISLGGLDNQVKAHIQGNLNMGQSRKDLLNIIAALIPYIGYPRALNAIAVLDSLTL
ncbi:carboxymuconolactone decarboxylase family protein [Campylobacter jejuni]|uniref:carboxymuconolactone decarboxylase family protein n=1 Tax=Campylobacter jejuni TaxID=197 RepID=UPI000B4C1FF1|nr:carboxymuconolactone decarboxylase family protein [Campylobacter jejuni]EAH4946999.1 carboxymuconolactone decarboxylase family protein [Campylobacter jejuni]EAI9165381.1 carboxymuconolactone decarboxylase family protein [Campylobacter jejuni]EAJ2607381.1 carboxymuconolactone decarboxylase family protein [Campylobacter jejuni]EAJ8122806.1 carboxymuconolactone decarboxylase family protein [Campylobacter jejuni]EAK4906672.1 carboxymuconolactone decarboxylase family protein [Campylobacter jejun